MSNVVESLPKGAGKHIKALRLDVPFLRQWRPCEWCGTEFMPKGNVGLERFCCKSCSAKWRMSTPEHLAKVHTPEVAARRGAAKRRWLNGGSKEAIEQIKRFASLKPMLNPKTRRKVSKRLREIGHGPHIRGGNGTGMTVPQRILFEALGDGWVVEHVVRLGKKRPGFPTHYKLDIANVERMVCIEVDGPSHKATARVESDKRKDKRLADLGWTVIRIKNSDVIEWDGLGRLRSSHVSKILKANGVRID